MPKHTIAGPCSTYAFTFVRSWQTVSQSGCSTSHSHQQRQRQRGPALHSLTSIQHCQHLLFRPFRQICGDASCGLTWRSFSSYKFNLHNGHRTIKIYLFILVEFWHYVVFWEIGLFFLSFWIYEYKVTFNIPL